VLPERVAECPLQIEAVVRDIRRVEDGMSFAIIEVEAVRVHAHESIVLGDRYVDPAKWSPLIYNFRHYFGLNEQLGKSFKSET
jgi:flavin reductase (DIM6/NTAB) family NADH-FMN oxidoreductase RutF